MQTKDTFLPFATKSVSIHSLWKLKLALVPLLLVVPGMFDVVVISSGLDAGFVPVSGVRELCQAAKPGNHGINVSDTVTCSIWPTTRGRGVHWA